MTPPPRHRRRRGTRVAATLAVAAGLLSGCTTAPGSAPGQVTLTVWSWGSPAEGLEAAVPAFEAAHPGVTVEVENVGNPAIWTKITTGLAAEGSGLADVMNIGVDYMNNYTEKFPDGLADLSELGADALAADYPNWLWDGGKDAAGTVRGIPYEVNTNVVFFRADLFAGIGVDVHAIRTWDELLDAGIRLKQQTGADLFALDKAASQPNAADVWQLLARLEGTFFFDGNGEITLNDPGSVAALDFLKRANDAGVVADVPQGGDSMASQLKGQVPVALVPSASWLAGSFPDNAPEMTGKWDVRRPPAMEPGGYTSASAGGTFLAVAGTSPHQRAAWEFVRFTMATLDGQRLVREGGGLFPSYRPMWSTEELAQPDDYFGGRDVDQLFVEALGEKTPPDHYTGDYAKALKYFTDAQTRVLVSGADPREALDDAAALLAQQTGRRIAVR